MTIENDKLAVLGMLMPESLCSLCSGSLQFNKHVTDRGQIVVLDIEAAQCLRRLLIGEECEEL